MKNDLNLLSVVIPARNEQDAIPGTLEHLYIELRRSNIPHELVVVDDGSSDGTWEILSGMMNSIPTLSPLRKTEPHGFGHAIVYGIQHCTGDAVCIMMADESDDCRDVVRYWQILNDGYDAVFGSRFIKGGGVIDYPPIKLAVNRIANQFLRWLFKVQVNDFTNAFKAYRMSALNGCAPLISHHFNLTIELPLKIIVRGYSWRVVPITWKNRRHGESKLKIKEMGSRYLFIAVYCWLEKYFSRGDYQRKPD
jgi:dolichol-phosphate mannosyltransferase